MSGFFVAPFGPADCYLGEIESLCGTGSPAERFAAALDLAERTDAPLHVARTLAAHAAHLRRTDPASREAAALAERARRDRRAGRDGAGAALDPTCGMGTAASALATGGLTGREREVIGLIAEGLSNRDIAAHLVISEHTAANHVRNILTKIGAMNRTQAAMYARERGLGVIARYQRQARGEDAARHHATGHLGDDVGRQPGAHGGRPGWPPSTAPRTGSSSCGGRRRGTSRATARLLRR